MALACVAMIDSAMAYQGTVAREQVLVDAVAAAAAPETVEHNEGQ